MVVVVVTTVLPLEVDVVVDVVVVVTHPPPSVIAKLLVCDAFTNPATPKAATNIIFFIIKHPRSFGFHILVSQS
ncbi:hypothetical protein AWM61_08740 [Riemerella anatipestifer]|nr:hypothetical protein AWR40_06715 [Riemerella anatipestifer]OBP43520.1 hypothetical protein AWR42_05575 [Riemerella anatipestifer]OBP47246.1 hypothetical protein AWM67_05985 [Riemerella anatipestifer]OBP47992.1 hypothetical protein AWM65_08120 [Riemerella anatipestifer]OBP51187.1 hypothetical protein AWM64_04930 [Riemerella anatipestifer]